MHQVGVSVGNVKVFTSSNGGHGPEFYASRLVDRLIYVADTAPEPIKAQALQYKEAMKLIVLEAIKAAMASERATVMAEINRSN